MSIATVCKKQTKAENRQETEKTVRRQIYGDLSDGRFFYFLFGKIRRIIKENEVCTPVQGRPVELLRGKTIYTAG